MTTQRETTDRCIRCRQVLESSIHHTDSTNTEIRMGAHPFVSANDRLAAYFQFQAELLRDLGWGDLVEKAIDSAKGKVGV